MLSILASSLQLACALVLLLTTIASAMDSRLPIGGQDFGIGFDLTPAYVTAAVSFENGSNIPLTRIEGDAAWRKMMEDISWNGQVPMANDATIALHVEVLTKMLLALVYDSEDRLGLPVTKAAVGLPGRNIVARYRTPVADLVKKAFAAARLEYLPIVIASYLGEPLLYPENTVVAGHNYGFCHPYTSPPSCADDNEGPRHLPLHKYYLVGYFANELEVTITHPSRLVYGNNPSPYLDYRLGANMRYQNPDESFYWEQVRRLLSLAFVHPTWGTTDTVILYGNCSKDEKLRATVKEVLETFLDDGEMPDWVEDDIDPVFAGAFGAAEFAKRDPYFNRKSQIACEKTREPKADL